MRYQWWMRFGRWGAGDPAAQTGRDVDELSDLADEVATRQPSTPEAVDAARRAVEAAERLLERDGGLSSQRRLARALWLQVSTFAVPAERDAVERTALRCWALCVGMLERARGDAVAAPGCAAVGRCRGSAGAPSGRPGRGRGPAGRSRGGGRHGAAVHGDAARPTGRAGRSARPRAGHRARRTAGASRGARRGTTGRPAAPGATSPSPAPCPGRPRAARRRTSTAVPVGRSGGPGRTRSRARPSRRPGRRSRCPRRSA